MTASLWAGAALTAGLNRSVGRTSKGKGSATEIAQFALGDLTFKVRYPHCIYSKECVSSDCAKHPLAVSVMYRTVFMVPSSSCEVVAFTNWS